MILSIKWLILQSEFSRGRRNGIIVSKGFLSSSVITELSSLEYSLIVLELCIQDKAQADDERRNNNERHCLFTPESCDKCRYQRYTDDKRTCADGSPVLRYIFFLDLSSVVGMYCANISHYVHDSKERDEHA